MREERVAAPICFFCVITHNTAMVILAFFFLLCSTSFVPAQSYSVLHVTSFGAVGDGKTDDSQAFAKAWNATCRAFGGTSYLFINRRRTFLLKPVSFKGPCNSKNVHVRVLADLVAPSKIADWNGSEAWISFSGINGLIVDGTGRVGGQGSIWWPCKQNPSICPGLSPTALYFHACNGLQLSGLSLHDNPRNHIGVNKCDGAVLSHLTITAPGDSPNTDGIDIANLNNIQIHNCIISTGDDCIAINNGTSNVNISYITCGPGHGISVGSLGGGQSYAAVEDIHVSHSTFTETMWAARIKTWKRGSGYARRISYDDIILNNVQRAITIDQEYDPKLYRESGYARRISYDDIILNNVQRAITIDQEYDPKIYEPSVDVSDVSFIGFHGTATQADAVSMRCGPGLRGCTNVVLGNVNITSAGGRKLEAFCQNAHGPPCTNCIPQDCVDTCS